MKKLIRLMEEQGADELLFKLAPFALAKYRRDSYDHLNLLCSNEKKLMAAVLSGVIVLWLIRKFNNRCREDLRKNALRDSFQELNQYLDSIQLVTRLDRSVDQQTLRAKAVAFLLDKGKRRQVLSSDLNESRIEHQHMLGQIIEAVRAGTGHSETTVRRHLSAFLNSICFTSLSGKPFTCRNLNK